MHHAGTGLRSQPKTSRRQTGGTPALPEPLKLRPHAGKDPRHLEPSFLTTTSLSTGTSRPTSTLETMPMPLRFGASLLFGERLRKNDQRPPKAAAPIAADSVLRDHSGNECTQENRWRV
ncbi:hypothetical protein AC781_12395 [Akkermansia glycaniphila]|nr:hypothetical protein AC781_12395 [Akkermansia glycaniphila]